MTERWMVIDDSATIQRVIKLAFQDFDVAITEAESPQEALRELGRSTPALIIADAALAGVQSIQDFSLLQQSAPQSAFVILEGSYDHIDETQFRAAGFKHFLKKPFDAAQLIHVTRQALGRAIPSRGGERPELPRGAELQPPPPPSVPTAFKPQDLPDVDLSLPPLAASVPSAAVLDEQIRNEVTKVLAQSPAAPEAAKLQAFPGENKALSGSQFGGEGTRSGLLPGTGSGPMSFDLDDEPAAPTTLSGSFGSTSSSHAAPLSEPSYNAASLSSMLEPMLQEEMGKIVRQTVEEYCRKHFAGIARELLLRELEKLTQERARLLVDK